MARLLVLIVAVMVACASGARGDETSPTLRLADLRAPNTTSTKRAEFFRSVRGQKIPEGFAKPIARETAEQWKGAFWGMLVLRERSDVTRRGCAEFLAHFNDAPSDVQRQGLEAVYGIYPDEFISEVAAILPGIEQPKLFAMAALYLARADSTRRASLVEAMKQEFPDWVSNPILFMLHHNLTIDTREELKARPPLAQLFAAPMAKNHPVIFSVQRLDRRHPGLAVLRMSDGRFLRNADGTIFHIPQMALSDSNLPGYITNGCTPEGIFSIQGTGVSQGNVFIGKTPFLWSVVPFEVPQEDFLHAGKGDAAQPAMEMDVYTALLPESWRGYAPIREAWYAGKAGRNEMLIHGTTIDPEIHRGQPWYPYSPSLGCLTALEIWSPEDGHALLSDQLSLLNAFLSSGTDKGFLVVVDIDDQQAPVSLGEIVTAISAAEATLKQE